MDLDSDGLLFLWLLICILQPRIRYLYVLMIVFCYEQSNYPVQIRNLGVTDGQEESNIVRKEMKNKTKHFSKYPRTNQQCSIALHRPEKTGVDV